MSKQFRVAMALGGFLIFIGTIMVAIFVLAFFNVIPFDPESVRLFMWFLLISSSLSSMSGILLAYRRR